MLNAAAMKDLLSENVDENASHFAFFSRAGTIMGHDHAADVKAVKRFAAFAANTWAHNDISIKETGRTVNPLTPGTTILQAVINEDGSGLHCLIVQVNDLVGAVTHVREGTLLAALKGKEEFVGETDEVAAGIKGVDLSKGGAQGRDVSQGDGVSEGEDSGSEDSGKGKGKGKEVEEVEEAKPSKIQILVWRSEGMGEYMANELGPKFRIPKGFH
ncbi:hypothetical protein HO133_007815 [Letharia lupina]|uniref:Uncharacterized protein n=1 Tax=Letharia lupina TaxID=560253 RepID=A0A8H6CR70_9LECA|nr:uncharacterized protein HO133_007815 [Letharia lupina]KAF6228087.1 hypothetical protein HO133_007815 [Letharia lupina]